MQWWCSAQGVSWSWTWRPYPGVWLFVAALAVGYALLGRRYGGDHDAFTLRARRAFAAAGVVLLWAAFDWPIGALGSGYLASVHMAQYLLIAVAAPPLLLLGVPRPAFEAWLSRPVVGRVMRVISQPLVSLSTFVAIMGLTHWPLLVDGLMANQAGSFLLDMLWLVSGLMFWWPVAVALPERSWLKEPFKIGYLIVATLVNTGVFAFLTFSDVPLYATFELAPPIGSFSTRDDQLVAGLLMKLGGAVVLWTAITILFFRWVARSEREGEQDGGGGDESGGRRGVPARRGATAAVLVLLACMGVAACGPDSTTLEGPVVVGEPVTGARAALYLTARGGAGGDRLIGIGVAGADTVSLHHTDRVDGMMRMTAAPDGFAVPEGELLQLRPGGDHAMLEGLSGAFTAGDSVPVTLRFRSGDLHAWAQVVALADLEGVLGF